MSSVIFKTVSTLATITSCSIQVPLIYEIYKKKHADNISYIYISANFLCAISWFTYGILIHSKTLIISDALYFFMFVIVLGEKIYFNRKNEKNNTENEINDRV